MCLHQTSVTPILPEKNVPLFTITPYAPHRLLVICEPLISRTKHRKSKLSSKISAEHLENSLRIATTSTEPGWCMGFTKTRSGIPLVLCCCFSFLCSNKKYFKKTCFLYTLTILLTRAALKIMPPNLLSWPTTSEVGVGAVAVEAEPSRQYDTVRQMAAEGQSDKMESDMKVWMKQTWVTEFLHTELMAPTDICLCLLNVFRDQTLWAQWGSGCCVSAVAKVTGGHLCQCRFLQA